MDGKKEREREADINSPRGNCSGDGSNWIDADGWMKSRTSSGLWVFIVGRLFELARRK
jgi:hypothetical protein